MNISHPQAKAFFLALALLTRLPIPQLKNVDAHDSGRSALYYPLAGLIIGLVLYVPLVLFSQASPLLLASIITILWAMITGGLHLDGLADSADGWLGGMGDQEKTHRIMKDPVVGSAGVIAIVGLLLLKFAVLSAVFQQTFHDVFRASAIIIIAPIIARAFILLLFISTKYVRENGMANQVIKHYPQSAGYWVLGICGLISLYFSFWGLIFSLAGFWLLRRLMQKLLGGCTGDTIGATVEITEVLYLIGYALMF